MITWGATTVNKGPICTDRGPKCAGTVPPPQDFQFNHCLLAEIVLSHAMVFIMPWYLSISTVWL